jgi:beta-lactamase superfamily II metal-dependent hydrolase
MRSWLALMAFGLVGCMPDGAGPTTGACGGGTWRPGWLEIHHIDAGQAVSTLIVSPVGRSMLVDAGEASWNSDDGAAKVGDYVRTVLGCSHLDYVVISHFHVDHAGFPGHGGLWHLVAKQGFSVGSLLHRDLYRYVGASATTVSAWRDYLQSAEARALSPRVATVGREQVQLGGGVDFAFLALDGAGLLAEGDFSEDPAPPDENDYSIAALLRFGRFDYFTAGDLSGRTMVVSQGGYSYHDAETAVAARVKDVDVYRVSHHGSAYASNEVLLAELDPEVAIVQVGDDNRNGHPTQTAVNRLTARSAVYLTEHGNPATDLGGGKVLGDVIIRTSDGIAYTVGGDPFVATDPRRIDADGDGYFAEADPNDGSATVVPRPDSCDSNYQLCP